MKKLKLLFLAMFITSVTLGQVIQVPAGSVYGTFQVTDLGGGVRGDYHFQSGWGMYGSFSYGNWYLYKNSGLQHHYKGTIGGLALISDWMGNHHYVTLGANYHDVEKIPGLDDSAYWASDIIYQHFSFEAGITVKYSRVSIAFRTDILRWEPCIDVGYTFIRKSQGYCPYQTSLPSTIYNKLGK